MIELDKEEEELEYILIIEKCAKEKAVSLLSYSHFLLDYCDGGICIVKNPDEKTSWFSCPQLNKKFFNQQVLIYRI